MFESAIYRPFATFGGKDLYKDIYLKVAALIQSIVKNHPFLDGNKRIGFAVAVLFLEINGWRFHATEADATVRTLALAAGVMNEAEYAVWLKSNTQKA